MDVKKYKGFMTIDYRKVYKKQLVTITGTVFEKEYRYKVTAQVNCDTVKDYFFKTNVVSEEYFKGLIAGIESEIMLAIKGDYVNELLNNLES